jgi:hypothetical protein
MHVVRHHQRLDAAAQTAQAERRHGLLQVGRGGDVTRSRMADLICIETAPEHGTQQDSA